MSPRKIRSSRAATVFAAVAILMICWLPMVWPADPVPPPTTKPAAEMPAPAEARYKGKPISFWVRQLENKDAASRQEAVDVMAVIGPEASSAMPALLKTLDDDNTAVRMATLHALRRIGPGAKPAIPKLIEALSDRDDNFRHAAVDALSSIGPDAKAALPALLKAARQAEDSYKVQPGPPLMFFQAERRSIDESVLLALGRIGRDDKAAIQALAEIVKSDDVDFDYRKRAVQALGMTGPAAGPALVEFLRSQKSTRGSATEKAWISDATIDAIVEIGADCVPDLLKGLKEDSKPPLSNEVSSKNVIEALGRIGPARRQRYRFLSDCLNKKNSDKRPLMRLPASVLTLSSRFCPL